MKHTDVIDGLAVLSTALVAGKNADLYVTLSNTKYNSELWIVNAEY